MMVKAPKAKQHTDVQWIVSELYERLSGRKVAIQRAIKLLQPYRPMQQIEAALEELTMTVAVLDEIGVKEKEKADARRKRRVSMARKAS